MSSILAVGVGVAAAAFLVCPEPGASKSNTDLSHRAEQDYWHCEDREERQLGHWVRRSTREDLSPR